MASTSVPSGSPVIPAAADLYFSLEDAASRGLSHDELAKLLDESADFSLRVPGQLQAALREVQGGGGERERALRWRDALAQRVDTRGDRRGVQEA